MLRSACLVAICSGAVALGSVTSAQQPPREGEIVVAAQRLQHFLRRFVSSMTQTGPTDQLARWKDQVCPEVFGIARVQAEFIEDRIIEVGRTVRLRKGGAGCFTTLAVVVTADPSRYANDLALKYPRSLRTDGASQLNSFANTAQPVRWISVTKECGEACVLPNSRLLKSTKPALHAMIIVVDANRIGSITPRELADYVALVALTNPPVDGEKPTNSILSMFDSRHPTDRPFELTEYDLSFLAGLYGGSLNRSAKEQRSTIVNRMKKDLKQEQ